jgi:hypothetical protein
MVTTKNLVLTHIADAANQAAAVNTALNIIDAMTRGGVVISETNTPPGSPGEGDTFIVGTAPTGLFSSNAKDVAMFFTGFVFRTPKKGWLVYDQAADVDKVFDGTNWVVHRQGAAVVSLQDDSTGTPTDTINAIGATYDQDEVRDAVASLAAKLNTIISRMEGNDSLAP